MKSISDAHGWRVGTVTSIMPEATNLRSYCFAFEEVVRHAPGQHYELRLTSPDGYQAARLYSAAMPANGTSNMLQLTIALMPDGEVSPYIFDQVHVGSQLEIRGPLGRYFMWTPDVGRPVLLIGGGTGIIPLRAIRLAQQQECCEEPMKLLYSVKAYEYMPYKYELFPRTGRPHEDTIITFTDKTPSGWNGYTRRIDSDMIAEVLQSMPKNPLVYVCGPTPMVESAADALVAAGIDPHSIKTERFGPTA